MKYTLILVDVNAQEVVLTKSINWNAVVESKSQAKGFEFNGNKLVIKLCPKPNKRRFSNQIL